MKAYISIEVVEEGGEDLKTCANKLLQFRNTVGLPLKVECFRGTAYIEMDSDLQNTCSAINELMF